MGDFSLEDKLTVLQDNGLKRRKRNKSELVLMTGRYLCWNTAPCAGHLSSIKLLGKKRCFRKATVIPPKIGNVAFDFRTFIQVPYQRQDDGLTLSSRRETQGENHIHFAGEDEDNKI